MKKPVKIFIFYIYIALIIAAFVFLRDFSASDLLNYTPSSRPLAALFILSLFALKSISVFFPIIVLQILCGFLFSPITALLLSTLGTAIAYSIPFYIGRLTGSNTAEQKIAQNPSLARILAKQHKHEFFLSFFLRAISCLPADIISMYLGALKFRFRRYLLASVLGTFPGLIPATLMGDSIRDPFSPQFIIALSLTILSSLASLVIFHFYNKKSDE